MGALAAGRNRGYEVARRAEKSWFFGRLFGDACSSFGRVAALTAPFA
jgi:hypothetical protein